jgi:peptidoglycan/xylan/chitin deacetylase (PgdA/CDA1 family)
LDFRRSIRRLFSEPGDPVILMFHRITDPVCDPWGLCVSPCRFEEQMRTVKEQRIPLPMREFAARLADGTLPRLAVAVTFDDGYVDNLHAAKPILERAGVPATVFLATGYLGTRQEFWWDELARIILARHEPAQGAIVIAGRSTVVDLPALSGGSAPVSSWRAWMPPRTARERLYLDMWKQLQVLEGPRRDEALETVRSFLGPGRPCETDFAMSDSDVKRLLSGTQIEIGAHTETHQPLTALPVRERRRELERSRAACEALAGGSVEGFAYPHGDLDRATADLVRESGFRWACSTERAAVDRSRFDVFRLPRLQACNWTAVGMERQLSSIRKQGGARPSAPGTRRADALPR